MASVSDLSVGKLSHKIRQQDAPRASSGKPKPTAKRKQTRHEGGFSVAEQMKGYRVKK